MTASAPHTPTQVAQSLRIPVASVYRFIEDGELAAVVHQESLDLFRQGRRTVDTYTGPTALHLMAELDACDAALLAEHMERPGVTGSFFHALAGALRLADPGNRRALYAAFSVTLHGYLLEQRTWAEQNGQERA